MPKPYHTPRSERDDVEGALTEREERASWAFERAKALEAERDPRPVRGCCGTDVAREACECADNERAILRAEGVIR